MYYIYKSHVYSLIQNYITSCIEFYIVIFFKKGGRCNQYKLLLKFCFLYYREAKRGAYSSFSSFFKAHLFLPNSKILLSLAYIQTFAVGCDLKVQRSTLVQFKIPFIIHTSLCVNISINVGVTVWPEMKMEVG